MYYYNPMMDGHDWGWGVLMAVFWLVVIVAFIYLLVRLVKNYSAEAGAMVDPLDIAKARYAKGEITKDEFNTIKKELK